MSTQRNVNPIAHPRPVLLLLAVFLCGLAGCQSAGSANDDAGNPSPRAEANTTPTEGAEDDAGAATVETGSADPGSADPEASETAGEENIDEIVIDGAFIEVDGLQMRDMQCNLEQGADAFAMVEIVSIISEAKQTLDACHPAGAAVRVSFDWRGNKAPSVVESSAPDATSCVVESFSALGSPFTATCTAIVLIGDAEGATVAADAMFPLEEAD